MFDQQIVQFYNNIRSNSWPGIESYADYLQLPEWIKKECNTLHGFQDRKKQICDPDYWVHYTNVCVYKDLAFVPVGKCAYVYNTTLFTNLGWEKIPLNEIDIEKTKFFGVIMHPLTRRLKGLTEWLINCYRSADLIPSESNPWHIVPGPVDWEQLKKDLSIGYIKKLIGNTGVGDGHSTPYSAMFGSLLSKINWIPMDTMSDDQVNISMMNFFKLYNHNIELPLNDSRLHVSSGEKLQIFDIIKTTFCSNPDSLFSFNLLYSNDLKFYYNLLDTFTQDWQHI